MNYQQWYTNSKTIKSYHAGYDFGKLFYSYKPGLDLEGIRKTAVCLKVSKSLELSVYIQGFEMGYLTASKLDSFSSGNMLPLSINLERERKEMGKVSDAQQKVQESQQNEYRDNQVMADLVVPFCITGISKETGAFGEFWALEITIPDEFADVVGMNDEGRTLLRFGCTPSRDALMKEFYTVLPIHSAVLEKVTTSNGRQFYKFSDLDIETTCPCGLETVEPQPKVPPLRIKNGGKTSKTNSPF